MDQTLETERAWFRSWPEDLPRDADVKPAPLYTVVTESAAKFPAKACLRYQGRTLSYSQVDDLSSRFAGALVRLGVKKGDRVAVFSPNTPQFVVSYFGILKAGGVVVPCSPLYKARELEVQLKDAGAKVLVAANDVVRGVDLYASVEASRDKVGLDHVIAASVTDFLPGLKRRLAGLAKVRNVRRRDTLPFMELLRSSRPVAKPAEVDPAEDAAVLQYTGGTTGTSKGAVLTHYNLLSAGAIGAIALPLKPEDVSLAVLPLFHIFGMTACMNAPLLAGGEVVLLPRFDVKDVMGTIQKEKVTVFCGVPTMYIAINNHPEVAKFDLKTVRIAFSGGAALPVAVQRRFNEITGGNLVEGYGLTESSAVGTTNPFRGGLHKEGSIGIPFPSTDAKVVALDDPSVDLPVGEVGELALKGPQMTKGYWGKDSESKAILAGGWLLTGDVARMDEDGYFYIVDRKKDMINVAGLKVYPREVEEVLFEHPLVKEAAVIGIPDSYKGEAAKAFVVLKDPAAGKPVEELTAFCKERLANYKVPRQYEFVQELPKTLVGKVLRRRLREPEVTQ